MATIKEVAQRGRVSVGTVSNVLAGAPRVNPALRERVLAAIRELDYHPNHVARSLKIRRTKMIGMVISDITNPFFPQVVRGAEDAALERGYLLLTVNTDDRVEREKQALSVLRTRRVDGILLVVAPFKGDIFHIKAVLSDGIPIVCLDRVHKQLPVDSVSTNHMKGAQVCVRHLVSMGHRRIAVITGSKGLQTAEDRLEGYKQALREAKLKIDPELIREGDFRLDTGYRLTKDLLLGRLRPTALFVSNGMMALGALKALEEMKLHCPKDIALAVFDDLPFADALQPHLTAVSQPAYEIGHQGAELLIRRIEGAETSKHRIQICLDPELKIRESTIGTPAPRD
jgi:LacI family transcriptional regulator